MTAADASPGSAAKTTTVRRNAEEKDNGIWNRLLQTCSIFFDAIDVVDLALRGREEQVARVVENWRTLRVGGGEMPRSKAAIERSLPNIAFPSASTATKPTRDVLGF